MLGTEGNWLSGPVGWEGGAGGSVGGEEVPPEKQSHPVSTDGCHAFEIFKVKRVFDTPVDTPPSERKPLL